METNSAMSLDDRVELPEVLPAKDVDGVPYCRKHHCRMKQTSGGKKGNRTSYYSCPVDDCEEKAQKIKTERECIVPPQPLACPRCSKSGDPVYAERDQRFSTAAAVILKCPSCGWKSSPLPIPQFALAELNRRRRPAIESTEELGSR